MEQVASDTSPSSVLDTSTRLISRRTSWRFCAFAAGAGSGCSGAAVAPAPAAAATLAATLGAAALATAPSSAAKVSGAAACTLGLYASRIASSSGWSAVGPCRAVALAAISCSMPAHAASAPDVPSLQRWSSSASGPPALAALAAAVAAAAAEPPRLPWSPPRSPPRPRKLPGLTAEEARLRLSAACEGLPASRGKHSAPASTSHATSRVRSVSSPATTPRSAPASTPSPRASGVLSSAHLRHRSVCGGVACAPPMAEVSCRPRASRYLGERSAAIQWRASTGEPVKSSRTSSEAEDSKSAACASLPLRTFMMTTSRQSRFVRSSDLRYSSFSMASESSGLPRLLTSSASGEAPLLGGSE